MSLVSDDLVPSRTTEVIRLGVEIMTLSANFQRDRSCFARAMFFDLAAEVRSCLFSILFIPIFRKIEALLLLISAVGNLQPQKLIAESILKRKISQSQSLVAYKSLRAWLSGLLFRCFSKTALPGWQYPLMMPKFYGPFVIIKSVNLCITK